jgi:hypothetical protein
LIDRRVPDQAKLTKENHFVTSYNMYEGCVALTIYPECTDRFLASFSGYFL